MKILFVNPPLTWEERYGLKKQTGGNTPPLGLACLAAVTRGHGYETSLLDAAVLQLSLVETAGHILSLKPDIIGFTAATISIDNVVEIMKYIRAKRPELRMIVGGAHITAVPEETFNKYDIISLGVLGEAEITIIDLLDFISGKGNYRSLEEIPGLVFRKDGKLFFTPKRERIRDLNSLPFPAFDLLPDMPKYYAPPVHTVKRFPAAMLVTSRGCTGNCIFCDRSVFGNICTAYSADYVIAMIKELRYKYGIREIQFRDDNFITFRKRVLDICSKIIDEKIDIVWSCLGRLDMINADMLEIMKKAGCWQIWYGVESGSDDILKLDKKNITIKQIENAISVTNKARISAGGFFIIGHPGETEDDLKKTLRLILKLRLDDFHMTYMTPFPGSELYYKAGEFGSFENNWKELSAWRPIFIPYALSREMIERYSKKAYFKFYFRARIMMQYIRRVIESKHAKLYFSGFLGWLEWIFFKSQTKEKQKCT